MPRAGHKVRLSDRKEPMSQLFSALTLGTATLNNRLAVAPMTASQSNPDGSISEADLAWTGRVADDGYGAIITAAAAVSRESIAFHNQPSFADRSFLPGLSALAERINRGGAVSIAQLCHGGSRAIPELTGTSAGSASAYELPGVPGFVRPREFTTGEIDQIVDDFATAAALAAEAGFGGIEFHGANGYLFTQFLSTMTNLRSDGYGGSLESRARISREAVKATRERVPSGFVLGFRMTFEGSAMDTGLDIDESIQVMRWLAADGIDYGHISAFDAAGLSQKYPDQAALTRIREGVGPDLALMVAGGITSRTSAQTALDLGADLVAIGRAAIGNADLPDRFARDEPLAPTPYSPAVLSALAVGSEFQQYLTRWPVASMNVIAQ
jgi:2,4-dienoyl-CoA reductase-like NADH-dependent reductase (Old Yellow Enzyme family)